MARGTPKKTSYGEEMQARTRRERRFSDTEHSLPSISPQSSFQVAKTKGSSSVGTLATRLLSYLGPLNPRPAPITDKDVVWLLDNVAYKTPTGKWEAEFVAAVFEQEPKFSIIDTVQDIADKIGLNKDDKAIDTIQERIIPFTQDIEPGRQVVVSTNGQTLKLGPGGRNGISSDVRKIPASKPGQIAVSKAVVPKGTVGLLEMKTHFAEPEGWGVISDIDDTIKVTQTSDPIGILTTTFVSTPTPTEGMPEFYARLRSLLTPAAPFFYLSASPYNLYPFLRQFRDQYYPFGQLILRDASWMSIPGLLSNLTLGTEDYKVSRMQKVHDWLPKRKMICIGDSTQSDPEAYGDIYRQYPGWVRLILIRKVTDIAAVGIEAKNEPERFEKAFEGIPKTAWHVFESPTECQALVEGLVAQ